MRKIDHSVPDVLRIEQTGVAMAPDVTLTVSRSVLRDTSVAIYLTHNAQTPAAVWLDKDEALLVIAQIASLLTDD